MQRRKKELRGGFIFFWGGGGGFKAFPPFRWRKETNKKKRNLFSPPLSPNFKKTNFFFSPTNSQYRHDILFESGQRFIAAITKEELGKITTRSKP